MNHLAQLGGDRVTASDLDRARGTMAQPMSTISLNGQCLGQGAPLIDDILNIDWAGWIEQRRAVVAAIESQAGSSCLGPPGDYDDLTPMALGCELAYVPCFTLSGPR